MKGIMAFVIGICIGNYLKEFAIRSWLNRTPRTMCDYCEWRRRKKERAIYK